MTNFDELWRRLVALDPGRRLSQELAPLLRAAYGAIVARPYDPARVAGAVERLLEFLASPAGKTHANVVAVDWFFCLREGWEGGWEDEPEELADVLGDMGGARHDTVQAPEVAENFDSTPDQLLSRIRQVKRSLASA